MRFSQVVQFALLLQSLAQMARGELVPMLEGVDWDDEGAAGAAKALVRGILGRYGEPAAELGAEWYELCAGNAGHDADGAVLPQQPVDAGMDDAVDGLLARRDSLDAEIEDALAGLVAEQVKASARSAVMGSLARDREQFELLGTRYSRRRYGNVEPGFCSVPTGDTTCAFCIMQAGRGYILYSDFGGKRGPTASNVWHHDCDCVVVPYADAASIEGYDRFAGYAEMYEAADDMFMQHRRGLAEYPRELQERIDGLGAAGTNRATRERLVIMRYLFGLEH